MYPFRDPGKSKSLKLGDGDGGGVSRSFGSSLRNGDSAPKSMPIFGRIV
jgi:hypothetical protein